MISGLDTGRLVGVRWRGTFPLMVTWLAWPPGWPCSFTKYSWFSTSSHVSGSECNTLNSTKTNQWLHLDSFHRLLVTAFFFQIKVGVRMRGGGEWFELGEVLKHILPWARMGFLCFPALPNPASPSPFCMDSEPAAGRLNIMSF